MTLIISIFQTIICLILDYANTTVYGGHHIKQQH